MKTEKIIVSQEYEISYKNEEGREEAFNKIYEGTNFMSSYGSSCRIEKTDKITIKETE